MRSSERTTRRTTSTAGSKTVSSRQTDSDVFSAVHSARASMRDEHGTTVTTACRS